MVTRLRIEAEGASAMEVEHHLNAVADALDEKFLWTAVRGEQFIERMVSEPPGCTAFTGRLLIHPNVARDSGQVAAFQKMGYEVTTFNDGPFLPVEGVVQTALSDTLVAE